MENTINKTEKQKNSIIEFLRFIFALNVVKNHRFFPYQGSFFSPGRISVEFFFVLSGFLFVSSLPRYNEKSVFKDLFKLYKNKIFGLGLPLLIGLGFNLVYTIMFEPMTFNILGYLWYIHDMLIVFSSFIILRKLLKSDHTFWGSIIIITLVSSVFHSIDYFYTWGIFRAYSAIGLGMLVSKIPKIENKVISILGFILTMLAVFKILLFDFTSLEDELLNVLLYPALIYFAFQINFSNKILNYLGSLSFGLYAFQSIPRLFRSLGFSNIWIHFIVILVCSIIADLLKRLINFLKIKKTEKLELKT